MTVARKTPRKADSLDLPPLFNLVTLREAGDAFRYAVSMRDKAAGTLVWARRFQLAEFAVVLEPAEPLAEARLAIYPAMNALADTLALHCPPEKPVALAWPDTLLLDGGILGGGRLAWDASCSEQDVPEWIVFGAMLRTAGHYRSEPGEWTQGVALDVEGIWDVGPSEIVESFARHLMSALHNWAEFGPRYEASRWMERFRKPAAARPFIDASGNLCERQGSREDKRLLVEALAKPSWLDPKTGEPWL